MYITAVKNFISRIEHYNPYTSTMGFVRTILATGTLLTLIFNSTHSIMPREIASKFKADIIIDRFNAFLIFGPEHVAEAKLLVICLLIWIIIGYFPQISSIIHWWVAYSFFNFCLLGDGGDQIAAILCLLLIPVSMLDPRRNHWQNTLKPLNPYRAIASYSFILLIQIQVAAIYFHAAVGKFNVPEWVDGTAVYYWFNHNIYGGTLWFKSLFSPLLNNQFIVTSITWGTMAFELTVFTGLFMSQKRKLLLLPFALLFHFAILAILGLVSFFFSMATALMLLLFPLSGKISYIENILNKVRYGKHSKLHRRTKAKPELDTV